MLNTIADRRSWKQQLQQLFLNQTDISHLHAIGINVFEYLSNGNLNRGERRNQTFQRKT